MADRGRVMWSRVLKGMDVGSEPAKMTYNDGRS